MSDIESFLGTKKGYGIVNTTILMVIEIFIEIDKKKELHLSMRLSITFTLR